MAVQARAKAEAARAEFAYARQEAELLKQQAILNASLHELKLEKTAAAANAEALILEAAAEEYDYEWSSPIKRRANENTEPLTQVEMNNTNAEMQTPVTNPGHLSRSYQGEKAACMVNTVTVSPSDAKPQKTFTRAPAYHGQR